MKKQNLLKYVAALCLSVACILFSADSIHAEYVTDDINGISYQNRVDMSSGYAYSYAYGGGSYITVYLNNDSERISNIKSGSKYLLAKKTCESYASRLTSDWDYEQQKYTSKQEKSYGSASISFFAKKKGTYNVTFDVLKADGTVKCTKSIKVYVDRTVSSSSPIKSITYAGKGIYEYYPYTTKTSGKLKVKLKSGYSLTSIQVKTKDTKGNYVTKKVKNGKKITLAKSGKYTEEDFYSTRTHNPLFPETEIIVTVKNKKTKETSSYYFWLYTLNRK